MTIRIIACLDCKFEQGIPFVVKGVKFENLQIMGKPEELAEQYYKQGADEICFLDITATIESRKTMSNALKKASKRVFVPLTAGGGIKTIEDAKKLFKSGADRVTINSAAIKRPELISEIADKFGKQACVVAIDAKKTAKGFECRINSGKTETGVGVVEWAEECEKLGAGEILLTSFDRDGTKKGFDLKLIKSVRKKVSVPLIASGGAGSKKDFLDAVKTGADAVLAAGIFQRKELTIIEVKEYLKKNGIKVKL